jgi:hypothetical protein
MATKKTSKWPPQVKPYKHPTIFMETPEDEPAQFNSPWVQKSLDAYPVVRWKYSVSMFDRGYGNIAFLTDKPGWHATPKYISRIRADKTEEEIRMIADNTMLLLNIKDGVS